jgi:hypothetical protein
MARRRYLPQNTEELLLWYERYVSPVSLIAGFVSDNLILLKRVDLLRTNALFFFYLIVAACGILFVNLAQTGRIRNPRIQKITPFVPIAMQFAFGGLFSGYLSLYSRSAGYALSWIFVIALAALLLGNERFTRFYVRFSFQISLLFATLFSFLIFFLPVIFHRIDRWMFVASGLTSLAIIALFVWLLLFLMPELRAQRKKLRISIAAIFLAFNALYFLNIIPPLPLALKDAGVYHDVVHDTAAGDYVVQGELLPWYDSFLHRNGVFHEFTGETVYVYTAIFAPSGLSVQVLDQWQYYDPAKRSWITEATVSYPIEGGRDGGYEGYSEYPSPAPGAWRVNVVTQYGALIGQVSFTVEDVSNPPALVEEIK